MKRLIISDLDFCEVSSHSSISGARSSLATPKISTSLSTSLDTNLLTILEISTTPTSIDLLQIAVGSGAGAAAGAAAVGGRATAFSRATA